MVRKVGSEILPQKLNPDKSLGNVTELNDGLLIYPRIKTGLGSGSLNAASLSEGGGGGRLNTEGFQMQEEPDCSSSSTLP